MRTFFVILRREFAQLALTPAMYCVLAALTALYSYAFYGEAVATEQAQIQPLAFLMGVMALFLVPVIAMRSFAGEKAGGTLELLFTSPISPASVVLGKFAGCFLFYLLALIPYAGYVSLLAYYGTVDWGALAATGLGLALVGAAQLAAAMWVSALTGNVIVAAAGGCVVNFLFFMLSMPLERGAGVFSFPAHLSWWSHFKEVFARGMADTRSLVFFASYVALFLFLTWLAALGRGLGGGDKMSRAHLALAGAAAVAALNVALFAGAAACGWRELLAAAGRGEAAAWPLWLAAALALFAVFCWWRAGRRAVADEAPASRRGQLKEHLPAVLAALAATLVFANVNYLATRRFDDLATYHRWDLTANRTNTLAPATREALDLLEQPLRFDVFLSEHVNYEDVPLLRYVRDLLGEFTSHTPKVQVGFYDAVADPDGAARRAKELELTSGNLTQMLVVNYGERRMVLGAEALLQAPTPQQQMAGIKTPNFIGEMAMAIVARRLSDRKVTNVYFLAKVGEVRAFGQEMVANRAGALADALAWEAYRLRPWAFSGDEPVPPDCDVLAVTGFGKPFTPGQAKILGDYLNAGGRLLLLLPEPGEGLGYGRAYRTGLEEILEGIGIRPRGDLVFDNRNNLAGKNVHLRAVLDPAAPIRTNLAQTVVVMPSPQSLSVHEKDDSGWQVWRAVRSLKSSQRFYPEPGRASPETAARATSGAATLMAAASRPGMGNAPEARLLVAGGAAWVSNLFLKRDGNQAFALAAMRWLAGRHYQVAPVEREYLDYHLNLTPAQWRWLWWVTLVGFPEVWLLVAALVWWRRRE